MKTILEVRDLRVSYGGIRAVRGVSFDIAEGETVTIVGANGAGKTTILRAVSNVVSRDSGEIRLDGTAIGAERTHRLARKGLLHIPEGRGTLGQLSVGDNLRLAFDRESQGSGGYEAALAGVFEKFPRLKERFNQRAGSLSGGEQQMLALARAVVRKPRILLLDEPSLGLSPKFVKEVFALISDFKQGGMTILMVEQNARAALALAHRAYVLQNGLFVADGRGEDLLQDVRVLEHYLGQSGLPPDQPEA